eukprot:339270-Hanusia_phi.AAC.8
MEARWRRPTQNWEPSTAGRGDNEPWGNKITMGRSSTPVMTRMGAPTGVHKDMGWVNWIKGRVTFTERTLSTRDQDPFQRRIMGHSPMRWGGTYCLGGESDVGEGLQGQGRSAFDRGRDSSFVLGTYEKH